MEHGFLATLVIAFLVASLTAALMHRLRQSLLIGYLVAGALIGPYGLGWVGKNDDIEYLAEVGVIMLMFTLGVEFSVAQLRRLRKPALLGGSIQLFGTMILITGFLWLMYGNAREAIFSGCIVSLSSTVLVMKLLETSGGVRSPHGTATLGIAIYQDVMVVPMMLLLATFSGKTEGAWSQLLLSLGKSMLFLGISYAGAKLVAGRYLDVVAETRSKELFTITAVAFCLGIALLAQYLGLSLAMGAFVAGLMVSSSIYSHKILSDILPFRDCFLSIFFVSVGMLADWGWIAHHATEVLIWGCSALVVKTLIAAGACLACGYSIRSSMLAGFCLAEVGEFSFVILLDGVHRGTINRDQYQLFLGVIFLTLIAVPALWRTVERAVGRVPVIRPLVDWEARRYVGEKQPETNTIRNHVVLIGCGPFGQVVLQAVQSAGGRCLVLDLNSQTIRHLQKAGVDAIYGEAANVKILESLHLEHARAVVVTIPDMQAAELFIRESRVIRPDLMILARARFAVEIERLRQAGADEVVYEEMEAAMEMVRVLEKKMGDKRGSPS